jgi:hypothetical protein
MASQKRFNWPGVGLDGSVAARAFSRSRNSWPVPTTKPLCESATMSVPGPLKNRMAIPRGEALGEPSGMATSGAPSENRTVTGTAAPRKWLAREIAAAPGDALNVPWQTIPFACTTRWPAVTPGIWLMTAKICTLRPGGDWGAPGNPAHAAINKAVRAIYRTARWWSAALPPEPSEDWGSSKLRSPY